MTTHFQPVRSVALFVGALLALSVVVFGKVTTVFAQTTFVPLSNNLPGPIQTALNNAGEESVAGLINGLFIVSIGVAGLLAVIMITLAGIKYVGSDSFSSKSDAKDQIRSAVIGLLLLLASYLLLYTINPDLVNLSPLRNVDPVNYDGNQTVGRSAASSKTITCGSNGVPCQCGDGYSPASTRANSSGLTTLHCTFNYDSTGSAATEAAASTPPTPAAPATPPETISI